MTRAIDPTPVGRMLYAVGTTAFARAVGALGSLALALILGRVLGTAGLGTFAFSLAVCMLCVLVARGGHDMVLLRSVSRSIAEDDAARARKHARFAIRHALKTAGGLTAAALVWTFANPFALLDPESRRLLLIMLPAVPAAVLAWQFSGFFKGLRQPARAVLIENGGVAVLTILIFGIAVGIGLTARADTAGYAFLAANLGVLGISLWLYGRWTRRAAPGPAFGGAGLSDGKEALLSAGRAFFLINATSFLAEAGSFAVAGLLLSKDQVGLLWTAERLALTVGFVFLVAGPILQPRIAASPPTGRRGDLPALASHARTLCLLAGLPAACLLLLFPRALLTLMGEEFAAAAPYLRIMVAGHILRLVIGPVQHLLTMTWHEQALKRLSLILFAVGAAAYPVLIAAFGPIGFAICYAVLMAIRHVILAVLVRRTLGFWPVAGRRRIGSG